MVDDAEDLRSLLETMLGAAGYGVIAVDGGIRALEAIDAGLRPEIVVLDVQMPEMDGWTTLMKLRAHSETAATPVVLCTVKQQSVDLARAWSIGADGYITKPFQIADLLAEIEDVLARTPAQRTVLLEHRRSRITHLAPR